MSTGALLRMFLNPWSMVQSCLLKVERHIYCGLLQVGSWGAFLSSYGTQSVANGSKISNPKSYYLCFASPRICTMKWGCMISLSGGAVTFQTWLFYSCRTIFFLSNNNSVCHGQLLIRSVSQGHPDCGLYLFLLGGSLCCFKTYWSVDVAKETGWCHQIRFIISWGHRSKSPAWTCCS
jgi:hypothetical protein